MSVTNYLRLVMSIIMIISVTIILRNRNINILIVSII